MNAPQLPGRAIDIVHAAAAAAGIPLDRLTVSYAPGLTRPGWARLLVTTEQRTVHEAETLLRQLGVTEPTARVTVAAGVREARYEHECTALGCVVVVIRATQDIVDPAPATGLDEVIAQVDAARTAGGGLTDNHVPRPWDDDPEAAADRTAAADEAPS